jgi:hypothetical protein
VHAQRVRRAAVPPGARPLSTLSHIDYDDADPRYGLAGEVLVERRRGMLLVVTFVQLRNPIARAIWAAVAPWHRRIVPQLLRDACRRVREQ